MDNIFSLTVSIDVYLVYHNFLFVSHIRFISNPWTDVEICHPRVSFFNGNSKCFTAQKSFMLQKIHNWLDSLLFTVTNQHLVSLTSLLFPTRFFFYVSNQLIKARITDQVKT